jgi:hypothetical protein
MTDRRGRRFDTTNWQVRQGVLGQWEVVDMHGVRPLHDQDGVARLRAAYLIAQAPHLAHALEWALQRIEALERGYGHDDALLAYGWLTLRMARPDAALLERIERVRGQTEIDFEAAA